MDRVAMRPHGKPYFQAPTARQYVNLRVYSESTYGGKEDGSTLRAGVGKGTYHRRNVSMPWRGEIQEEVSEALME